MEGSVGSVVAQASTHFVGATQGGRGQSKSILVRFKQNEIHASIRLRPPPIMEGGEKAGKTWFRETP